eukprot:CAMPEP_0179446754 /NCGR_PEP_ID=MMETSP0799-20121207/30281_1 /TAXON_ID=46947 /ORGANISM="Geminigera cryophila, Strain CCMP2564" /LENGTH=175 /DNA_ID=CAMNT_0021236275 /DNA_START=15 /DNA_END=542 /DNA_ORIENTATION=+
MMRPVILAAALASATAFAPTASFAPRLRSAQATNMKMAVQPESTVSRAGFLAGLATAAVVVGVSVAPVDASINSQMSMDSNSFSVLTDNQKVYKSTGMGENPYLSETEKMAALERQARLEDCNRVKSTSICLQEEDRRIAQEKGVKKRGNSAATVAVPVVVTSGLSFALLKFLNK